MTKMIRLEGTVLHVDAFLAAGTAVVLLAGGVATGWILCRRDLERDYQERLDAEVAATQVHFYGQLAKEGLLDVEAGKSTNDHPAADEPDLHVGNDKVTYEGHDGRQEGEEAGGPLSPADVGEVAAGYGADALARLEDNPDPAPVVRNLFEDRDTSRPFDISLTEFCNIEPGWMQLTLHYYPIEDIVTDDKDESVPAYAKLCGPIDASMFDGVLSEDPAIVYRRNNQTGADYEIVKMEDSYNEKVFGIKEE